MPKWKSDPKDGLVPIDYAAALIYAEVCKQDGKQVPPSVTQLIVEGEVASAQAVAAEKANVEAELKAREAECAKQYKETKV